MGWIVPTQHRFCRTAPLRGSDSGCEGEQPLHVVGHGHEVPLAADVIEATEQELAEAERRFDDAEHRLGGVLAQAYSARPSCVFSRCAIAATGVGLSGGGGVGAKRSASG